MKKHTPALFFIAAAVFALNGVKGILSGFAGASGFAMGVLWLAIGVSLRRKQRLVG